MTQAGCELFKGAQEDLRVLIESHPELEEHHKLDDTANFDTLRGATLLLLTIFAGCNWSYAMLRVMEVG